ncbi:MAG: serine/threonine protein kinase [Gammaproteobacteria bacterium]|jgi:Ser/Thr protein kinase RdoA (MazF antagonist)|nr:serine/threonine protein kinase [Gammaproteobacteria bacterium]
MGFNRKPEDNKEPAKQALSHPYTRLTPDCVIAAVESTGRFSDARILALNSYENRVYQVGIEDESPVIVKFYRPNRWTPEQIDEEHRFTRLLLEHELPVVPPLEIEASAAFPTIGIHDGFMFSIYPRQGGRAPELDDLDHLHQLGLFIGRIHAVGAGFPFRYRQRLSVEQAATNVSYLQEAGFIPHDLQAAYQAISSEILEAIEERRPDAPQFKQISLHGDCHKGNVLWRDDKPHFVDFDDAISGPAIQDLWMLLSGDMPAQQRQLLEIIEGYETFQEFNQRELDLIEPLRAMRVLYFNAWLARRWDDPAFPMAFPWFNTERYWSDYILELKELLSQLQLPPIAMPKI